MRLVHGDGEHEVRYCECRHERDAKRAERYPTNRDFA